MILQQGFSLYKAEEERKEEGRKGSEDELFYF